MTDTGARLDNLVSDDLQRAILKRVMAAMVVGAGLVMVLSFIRVTIEGFQPKFAAMWIVALGIFLLWRVHERWRPSRIGLVLYGLFTAMGSVALLNTGIASIGAIFLFIALAMASIVFDLTRLIALVLFQLGLFAIAIVLINADMVAPLPANGAPYLLQPKTWAFHGVVIAVGGMVSFYGTSVLGEWYRNSLEQARKKFFHGVAVMSLAHDTETGQHIDRVSLYAAEVYRWLAGTERARELTFSVDELANAVKLHDLGKISISDGILKKPGKLTAAEFEKMKKHTVLGAQIITTMMERSEGMDRPTMSLARDIARSHHENWQGGGYPDGLEGEQIPLAARIMSLCDVYDALRSARTYKPGWSHEATIEEMLGMENKFDPVLLAAFRKHSDRFESLYASAS